MNARGIPPAAYQVLHLLSYPTGGGVPHLLMGGGTPSPGHGVYPIPGRGGGYPIPGWGTSPRLWTDKQTETITFPHPSDAGGKKTCTFLGIVNENCWSNTPDLSSKYFPRNSTGFAFFWSPSVIRPSTNAAETSSTPWISTCPNASNTTWPKVRVLDFNWNYIESAQIIHEAKMRKI